MGIKRRVREAGVKKLRAKISANRDRLMGWVRTDGKRLQAIKELRNMVRKMEEQFEPEGEVAEKLEEFGADLERAEMDKEWARENVERLEEIARYLYGNALDTLDKTEGVA